MSGRTHHATRTFRLSCGCLRNYPGMPAGKRHKVLCTACGSAQETLYSYPDTSCGEAGVVLIEGIGIQRVQCTRTEGSGQCGQGMHYDEFLKANFGTAKGLSSGARGETRRA